MYEICIQEKDRVMEENVVGLLGNTEDPLEIISNKFKLRLRSLQNVFLQLWSDAQVKSLE